MTIVQYCTFDLNLLPGPWKSRITRSSSKHACLELRTDNWPGYLLGFPATLFLRTVLSALPTWSDARGGKFTTNRPTCYVSKHTMVYDEGEHVLGPHTSHDKS